MEATTDELGISLKRMLCDILKSGTLGLRPLGVALTPAMARYAG